MQLKIAPFFYMNYKETIQYLFHQLPMFQRVGAVAFKKDLGNIKLLCERLSNPQNSFKSIHIAGTNGKGSTGHLLSSVCQAAGLKTGLYTSPHYKDFRERIKISGQLIPKKTVVEFVANCKTLFEEIQPSFFEITVALAFHHFSKERVDIAIIETGLGGRLDSTNIITPLLSVITNISFDHQNMLGDTLPKIASEKAGIIKHKTPVVIGERQKAVEQVFLEKAKEQQADIYFASDNIQVEQLYSNLTHSYYKITDEDDVLSFERIPVNIHGTYQTKNIATTLETIKQLQKVSDLFDNKDVLECIKTGFHSIKTLTNYMGRWQLLGKQPTILCDSAHNEGGLKLVLKEIEKLDYQKLHFVYGTVSDKDLSSVLPMFPTTATYYFAKADIPRGMNAKTLKAQAESFGLNGRSYVSVKNALAAAKRNADKNDLIFIGGSIFVVAEVI